MILAFNEEFENRFAMLVLYLKQNLNNHNLNNMHSNIN